MLHDRERIINPGRVTAFNNARAMLRSGAVGYAANPSFGSTDDLFLSISRIKKAGLLPGLLVFA